jgi:hypothetical protein
MFDWFRWYILIGATVIFIAENIDPSNVLTSAGERTYKTGKY